MKSSAFENVIIDALSAVDYIDTKDNRRFLSAVQDLALDYPNERKYVQYYVDDRYLEICKAALHCDSEQLQPISQKAADYVRQEYANDGQWNDTMSEALARAFYLYGNKAKAPVSASDVSDVPEKPEESEQQKQSERPKIPNRPEGSTEPEGPVGGKRTKKINRKIPILITAIVLLVAGGVGLAIGHSSGDSSGNEQNTYSNNRTQEITFVPDYSYPERQIRFEVPSNAAVEGPDMTNEIYFNADPEVDSDLYGIISSYYGSSNAWIETDEERIALWEQSVGQTEETLKDSGFITIDDRTCSWFETESEEFGYGYYLVMPFDTSDAGELEMRCSSYDGLTEYIEQILSTITIKSE